MMLTRDVESAHMSSAPLSTIRAADAHAARNDAATLSKYVYPLTDATFIQRTALPYARRRAV